MTRPTRSSSWLFPACLALFCLVIYGPGRFENTSGDNISTRYWPVAILKHGTLSLDPFKADLRGVAYAAIYLANGSWAPRTGWGMLPLVVPVYAAADAYGIFGSEWTHDRISRVGRLAGIVWATASVVLLYYVLLNIVSPTAAFFSALLFAAGTWNWSLGAQGPSTQAAVVLLHVVNLHLLWRYCGSQQTPETLRVTALLLGVLHAWIWSVRPSDLFLFAPAGLLILERRRALIPYLLPLGAGVMATALLNKSVYGAWLGFYGILTQGMKVYRWNPVPGASGLLVSPNCGALVFFPLLLLVPYLWTKLMPVPPVIAAMRRAITGRFDAATTRMGRFSLALALGTGAYLLSLTILEFWHGAWSYGPRYLYDLQPYVWPAISLALAELGKRLIGRKALLAPAVLGAVLLLSLQGVVIHGLGHRNYDFYIWNLQHSPIADKDPWDTDDWIIADAWRAGSNRDRWPSALDRLRRYGF